MRQLTFNTLICILSVVYSSFSYAGIIDIPKQTLRYDGSTYVQVGNTASVSAPSEAATFNDITRKGLITLAVDHHYGLLQAEVEVTVEIEVTPYYTLGSPGTPFTIFLDAENKANSELTFDDKAIHELDDVYAFDIEIMDILVNGSPGDLPENYYIDAELYIDRIFDFSDILDEYPNLESIDLSKIIDADCDDVKDVLLVRWDPIKEAEEYQLEWTYVNDYTDQNGVYLDADEVKFDFRFNSSRISTSSNEYKIPLTYDHGYVIYRVRAVGRLYTDPTRMQYSLWSLPSSGVVDDEANGHFYFIQNAWEISKNWQYNVTFAEEGKRKEVVSFFDGSLRNRQMVTLVSTNSKAIVGETIYDHQGRPAIQVLPTPVLDPDCGLSGKNTLKYYEDFNRNAANAAYNRLDFDASEVNSCEISAAPMNSSSGASFYYSTSNTENTGSQAYVPNAGGFPFSQVEYTPDNTGRIRRQGGVGATFQLGEGHETKYFYGHPAQIELDRMFGSEVGCASHYQKNMVIDPNGQVSVSYLDQEGRVIATSLAGEAPSNVSALPSYAAASVNLTDNIIVNGGICNSQEESGNSFTVNQTILISSPTTVTINYDYDVSKFTDECLAEDICFGCVYDLKIDFKDQCGISLVPEDVSSILTGHFEYNELDSAVIFNLDCDAGGLIENVQEIVLENVPVGSYQLSKSLSLNEDAIAYYEAQFLDTNVNTCLLTLEDFQEEFLENADYSGCGPDTTCQQCLDNLPELEDYLEAELGTEADYALLVADCDALCQPVSMYKTYRDFLLMDMNPGGQYAEYLTSAGVTAPGQFPLSILNSSNGLPHSEDWRTPHLIKEGVVYSKYYDANLETESKIEVDTILNGAGVLIGTTPAVVNLGLVVFDPIALNYTTPPENLANVEDFIQHFESSWAYSLIYYHPEYNILKTYEQLTVKDENDISSESFDDLMNRTETWEEAITNGFIVDDYDTEPVNDRLEKFDIQSTSHAYDPFLIGLVDTSKWTNKKNRLINALTTEYITFSSSSFTLAEVGAFTHRCGGEIGQPSYDPDCFGFGEDSTGGTSGGSLDEDTNARDLDWQNFKAYYRALKQQLIAEMSIQRSIEIEEYYGYNGCIGNNNFDPTAGGFFAPEFDLSESQYTNLDQPCNFSKVHLYASKVKRFMLPSDVGGLGNGVNFTLTGEQISDLAQQASYDNTGDCPLATAIVVLSSQLAEEGELLATAYDLEKNEAFVGFVNAYQGISNPVALLPEMDWDAVVVNDSTLYVQITDISGTVAEIRFELFEDSLVDWNEIDGFMAIQATGTGGLGYTFTAHAVAYYPDSTVYYPLKGSTTLDIFNCTFPEHCVANDLGSDLFALMNALAVNREVFNTSDVTVKGTGADPIYVPFVSDRIGEVLTNTSSPASDVFWKYNPYKFHIGIPGSDPSTAREIVISIDNYLSLSFLSDTRMFSNMHIIDENSVWFTAFDEYGDSLGVIYCSIYLAVGKDETELQIGNCEDPQTGCVGLQYQNTEDVEELLRDVLVAQDPGYDIFASTAMTDHLAGQFPGLTTSSGTTTTVTVYEDDLSTSGLVFDHQEVIDQDSVVITKTYYTQVTNAFIDTVMDSVRCETGETGSACDSTRITIRIPRLKTIYNQTTVGLGDYCSLILRQELDTANNYDLSDITNVLSFALSGEVDEDGYYHQFTMVVEMDGGVVNDTVYGEICLPMLPCNAVAVPFNPTEPFPEVVIENPCYALVTGSALAAAESAYNDYIDSLRLDFRARYTAHCMSTIEHFNRSYDQREYHFTLYYYDQAGNLVKTVPPEGVELLPITSSDDVLATEIQDDRNEGNQNVITNHRMATVYAYNSLNQLTAQHMPDMDDMSSWNQTLANGLDIDLNTTAIQMIDEGLGYLTGYINNSASPTGSRGYLYRTLDGGTNWTRLTSLFKDDLLKVRMASNTIGFAVGANGTVLRTEDGGGSWDLMDLHNVGVTGNYVDLAVYNTTTAAFLRSDGAVLKYNSSAFDSTLYTPALSGHTLNTVRSIDLLDGSANVYLLSANFTKSGAAFDQMVKIDLSSGTPGSWTTTLEETFGTVWSSVSYSGTDYGVIGGIDGDLVVMDETGSHTQTLSSSGDNIGTIVETAFYDQYFGVAIIENASGQRYLYKTATSGNSWAIVDNAKECKGITMTHKGSSYLYIVASMDSSGVCKLKHYSFTNTTNTTLWTYNAGSAMLVKLANYYINGRCYVAGYNGLKIYTTAQFTAGGTTKPASLGIYFTYVTGSTPASLRALNINSSGNDMLHIVVVRSGGSVEDIYSLNGAASTRVTISPASTNFKDAVIRDNGTSSYILAYNHTNTQVYKVGITTSAPTSGSLSAISNNTSANIPSTATFIAMGLHGDYLTLAGSDGLIYNSTTAFSGSPSSISWENRTALRLSPIRDLTVSNYSVSSVTYKGVAAGDYGVILRRNSSSNNWFIVPAAQTADLRGLSFASVSSTPLAYIIGGTTTAFRLNLSTNAVTALAYSNTPTGTFSDVSITSTSAGGYGIISSSSGYTYYTNSINAGSPTLSRSSTATSQAINSVCFGPQASGTSAAVFVGNSGLIKTFYANSSTLIETVFGPKLNSIHFANDAIGTVVGERFFVRSTTNSAAAWTKVFPSTLNSSTLKKNVLEVWTRPTGASSHYAVIGGTNYLATVYTATATPTGTGFGNHLEVTDIQFDAANPNVGYIAQKRKLYRITLSTSGASYSTSVSNALGTDSLGTAINAIHVFNGGGTDNAVIAVGNNMIRYKAEGAATTTSMLGGITGKIKDVDFSDQNHGYVAGDDGLFYQTDVITWNSSGTAYTAMSWLQKTINDGYSGTASNLDIEAIEFPSATRGVWGGSYETNPVSGYAAVRVLGVENQLYSSRFYYDRLGRIVASQNSRQKGQNKYSYTLYDALGRVVEAGEKTENSSNLRFADIFGTNVGGQYITSVIDDEKLNEWITEESTTTRKEVTRSYYDETNADIAGNGLSTYYTFNTATQRKRIVHVTYEAVYDDHNDTYDHATHYNYDIHGNVKTLIQDNKKLGALTSLSGQRFKKMDYTFDLISGNVHRVDYQTGKADQWHHAYVYDADNRITDVYTTTATPLTNTTFRTTALQLEPTLSPYWDKEAHYAYYDHGPLARTVIGEQEVQGLDYVYTLQGWIKGVNSNRLNPLSDQGMDGAPGYPNAQIARDVMSYSLHYFDGDYENITSNNDFIANQASSDLSMNAATMFNGNIGKMVVTITHPDSREVLPLGNAYQYDQLNRLEQSVSFNNLNLSSNAWSGSASAMYTNTFAYDANGNIDVQGRLDENDTPIDVLFYNYNTNSEGKKVNNRLYSVTDAVDPTDFPDDIDDQGVFYNVGNVNLDNNYAYDAEGRLIKDVQEEIASIEWRVDGKVKAINRTNGSSKKNLKFDYDAMGHRIAKHVLTSSNVLERSTYYVLDAQGNVMSTYEREIDNETPAVLFAQKERYIYGSSRLGVMNNNLPLYGTQNESYDQTLWTHTIGERNYELSNHLGNVLSVISDKIIPHVEKDDGVVSWFLADIIQSTDYSPFGVQLSGRNFTKSGVTKQYRQGFNGMEQDDEIKGDGNSYDFGARMLDPRLGRWLTMDALTTKYPDISPYVFVINSPIMAKDPDGNIVVFPNKESAEEGRSWLKQLGIDDEFRINSRGVMRKIWTPFKKNDALTQEIKKSGKIRGSHVLEVSYSATQEWSAAYLACDYDYSMGGIGYGSGGIYSVGTSCNNWVKNRVTIAVICANKSIELGDEITYSNLEPTVFAGRFGLKAENYARELLGHAPIEQQNFITKEAVPISEWGVPDENGHFKPNVNAFNDVDASNGGKLNALGFGASNYNYYDGRLFGYSTNLVRPKNGMHQKAPKPKI